MILKKWISIYNYDFEKWISIYNYDFGKMEL